MTCIVGIEHEGSVWIGADSAGVSYPDLGVRHDKKVFINGTYIMGFTSSFRMGQLLAYSLIPPKRHPDIDPMKFMVTEFINAVRTTLKDGGYAEREKEAERGGTFLVGYEGKLYKIESDYQVNKSVDPFAACGCGDSFALGSLHSHVHVGAPEDRIKLALSIAERCSAGVRGPFNILRL